MIKQKVEFIVGKFFEDLQRFKCFTKQTKRFDRYTTPIFFKFYLQPVEKVTPEF